MKKIILLISLALIFSMATNQAHAKLPQMMVSAYIGYNHPTGDFSDYADRGLGVGANFDYFLMPNLSIYGMIGYTSWSNKDLDQYTDYFDLKMTEIPIKGGAKFFLSDENLIPYIGAELGIHMFSFKYEVSGFGFSGTTESESEIGIAPLAGIMIPISDNIYFNGCAKYTIIKVENYYEDVTGSISFDYLTIFAGVSIGL